MTSILLEVYRAPVPRQEAHHQVRLYQAGAPRQLHGGRRRLATTSSINGLCYVVAMSEAKGRRLTGRWLDADGRRYLGDRAIRWWVREYLPESLARARRIVTERLEQDRLDALERAAPPA